MTAEELIYELNRRRMGRAPVTVSGWDGLARLFFTTRGCEYCVSQRFPSLAQFKDMDCDLSRYGIYVSCGTVALSNPGNVAVIGGTRAYLTFSGGTRIHRVVLMYGAKAELTMRDGAIVRLVDEEMNAVVDKDDSSIIIY